MNHLKTIWGCKYDVVLVPIDGLGEPPQDHLGVGV